MRRGLAMGVMVLLAVAGARAEDDFKVEDGFVSLFNGKDLTGWRYKGSKENLEGKTETPDKRIAVENGVIVMREKDQAGKGGIKDLYTVKEFPRGFHLKVEFRAGPRADSGVYVRGPQLQVRDYLRRNEKKHLKEFKTDGWNTLDIVVRNDVVTTLVNGQALGEKDEFSLAFKDGKLKAALNGKVVDPKSVQVRRGPIAECRCNGEALEVMTNIPGTGGIGLQAESGKFEFRRVRVKEEK
ncbi:MAG: DUF1080 domain-containing protein [Gemmataceae bacterium]